MLDHEPFSSFIYCLQVIFAGVCLGFASWVVWTSAAVWNAIVITAFLIKRFVIRRRKQNQPAESKPLLNYASQE